jgi:tRNA (guanine37-N1)-methyltransferase
MKIDVITLFPGMFDSPLSASMIKRAREKGIVKINIHDLRKFTNNKHRTADDRPFGGSPGMVLKLEPIYKAIKKINKSKKTKIILLSPQGDAFNQSKAKKLAKDKHLIFICGHYEGVDERVMKFVDEEISIGNYVLTGGELPAMVTIDAIVRLVPGVVKEKDSIINDSFFNGLLDYPKYTRPRVYHGMKVPEILLSGHHRKIHLWQNKESIKNTYMKKPNLLKKVKLDIEQKNLLNEVKRETSARKVLQ